MTSSKEEREFNWKAVVPLGAAFCVTVGLWILWLFYGINIARNVVASGAPAEGAPQATQHTKGPAVAGPVTATPDPTRIPNAPATPLPTASGANTGTAAKSAGNNKAESANITMPALPNAATPAPASPAATATGTTSASDVRSDARPAYFAEIGQTGDSFGALNALLTAIAGSLVFWAGYMQYQALRLANEEAKAERKARQIQQFETLFFQMLSLSRELTARIRASPASISLKPFVRRNRDKSRDRTGAAALESYAYRVAAIQASPDNVEETLRRLVTRFHRHVYSQSPSAFGPYFRLLFQTFKHIEESQLSEGEKLRYANIARGQISEGAVLLLALNGLGLYGRRFIPLIEKFGLLEHLHPRYRREFGQALRVGYRDRAFEGSEKRAQMPYMPEPLLADGYFDEPARRASEEGEAESEFSAGFSGEEPET